MTTCYNPALSEAPRNQPMRVIPLPPKESLVGWLESSGRFQTNEIGRGEPQDKEFTEVLDEILETEVYALGNEEDLLG